MRTALLRLRRGVEVRGRVSVGRGVRIAVARDARVILEDGCSLGERSRIEAGGGTITIGRGARIGERAVLVAVAGIEVGPRVDVGDWAVIADADPAFADAPAPVTIGEGARIGLHAAVLAGAAIAAGEEVAPYETRAGDRDERAPRGRGPGDQETRAPRRSA